MPTKKQKLAIIIGAALLTITVAVSVYFIYTPKNVGSGLLVLKVYDEKLTVEQVETINKAFNAAVESLKTDPDSFNDWITIGILKKQVNDFEGARAVWEKMALINPSSSLPLYNLANLYADFLSDADKAESYYLRALQNSPQDANIYTNLASLYKNKLKDKEGDVESLILKGLENTNNHPTLLAFLGAYFEEKGDYEKSLHYFELLHQQKPDDSTIVDEITRLKARIK